MRCSAILISLLVFVLSCGGGGGSSAVTGSSTGNGETIEAPSFTDDGVTGGSFADESGNFSVTIPSGSMPEGLSASPEVSSADTPDTSILLETGETLVSDSYRVSLDAIDHFVSTDDVSLTLNFDSTDIPSADLNALKVYVKMYLEDEIVSLSVPGTVTSSSITIAMQGLPNAAIYQVVYNPNMAVVTTSVDASVSKQYGKATSAPPWPNVGWAVRYNPEEPLLKTTAAAMLTTDEAPVTADTVTAEQIASIIRTGIEANAVAAEAVYEQAEFRAPNLTLHNDAALTGGRDMYVIEAYPGSSKFTSGALDDSVEDLHIRSGILYIGFKRLDDAITAPLGSVRASVAHEMLHAIRSGYDIGSGSTLRGLSEGTATTYGITIDNGTTVPQVRSQANEDHSLSNYLFARSGRNAYANQDFFAYIGRVWNGNNLNFISTLYAALKTAIDADVAEGNNNARIAPAWATVWDAVDSAIATTTSGVHDFASAYHAYATDRAVEHSTASELRSEAIVAGTLNDELFSDDAVNTATANIESLADTALTGTVNGINQYSSAVLTITPSNPTEEGLDVSLTLSPSIGAIGNALRATVYRAGSASGTALEGAVTIEDFGTSTGDTLLILMSNTAHTGPMAVEYTLEVESEEEEESSTDSVSATIRIDGNTIDFSPTIAVGAFGSFSGNVQRTNLPGFQASEGSSLADISQDMLVLLSDPFQVAEGTYALGEAGDVYEDGTAGANLSFSSPSITDGTNGDLVVFDSTSGTITFTSYGTSVGERIAGTFSATVEGTRDIDEETREDLTGTISGSFDVELQSL